MEKNIKNTLIELITELEEYFTDRVDDFLKIKFFIVALQDKDLADEVSSHLLLYSREIETKNTAFFLKEKNNIFPGVPSEKLEFFSNHIESGKFSEDNLNVIWDYFKVLLKLSEEYKKNK